MFDHNSIMALKELIGGEQEEQQMIQNPSKGSALIDPGRIGGNDNNKKQKAKPYAKIQTKIGQKYVPKNISGRSQDRMQEAEQCTKKAASKHDIWTEQEVASLPILKEDPRPRPQYTSMYRQRVGTQDVYLGMSGVDPSSNHCQQILYKIQLPDTETKDIQLDLNDKQMVIQTKKFYLIQHFQYPMDFKKAKAKFIADKGILQLGLPIIRQEDF